MPAMSAMPAESVVVMGGGGDNIESTVPRLGRFVES